MREVRALSRNSAKGTLCRAGCACEPTRMPPCKPTDARRRSTPEPTMLIGKTDPFIAVFTKGERSEPWSLVGTTGTRHLRCIALCATRSGSSSAARGLGAVNARFGAGNRGAREAQRAKVLTPTGGADILPKTTAPEFKKPVLVDFFFEENQLLRFQVRSAAARAQRYGAEPLTGARAAHVRRCSASARGPGHDW